MHLRRAVTLFAACLAVAGAATSAVDSAHGATTASISGTVREAGTGTPLAGVGVTIVQEQPVVVFGHKTTATVPIAGGVTNADGTYTVAGLAPDPGYYVCFSEGFLGGAHLSNCYLNAEPYIPQPNAMGWVQVGFNSQRVRLVAGQHATRIDSAMRLLPLDGYGAVSGKVTQRFVGAALKGVRVTAFNDLGTVVDEAFTQAGGAYLLDGLLPSASGYRVCFDGSLATGGATLRTYGRACYRTAAWGGGAPPTAGVVRVPVALHTTTPNISIALSATI